MFERKLNTIVRHSAIQAAAALSKNLRFPLGVEVNSVESSACHELQQKMFADEKIIGGFGVFNTIAGAYCLLCKPKALHEFSYLVYKQTNIQKAAEKNLLCETAGLIASNFLSNLVGSFKAKPILFESPVFVEETFEGLTQRMVAQCKKYPDHKIVDITFHLHYANFFGMAWFIFSDKEFSHQISKVDALSP